MEQPVVLLAGGKDKGNDYGQIMSLVNEKVRHLICLTHYPDPLEKAFSGIIPMQKTESVDEAVAMAYRAAQPGDVVLLSPACASFDLFKNYEDRGDQFRAAVHQLMNREKRTASNSVEEQQPSLTDNHPSTTNGQPSTGNQQL
jgi:UDP-N-acetylmuramoylalanine--D-glutamate ligase